NPHRASVTTWLLAITRNLAIDALRRRGARPLSSDSPGWREPLSQAKSPDELAVATDAASRLRDALRQPPPEPPPALVRAFCYGQTAQEISIAEGIPLGTAKTRIRLGMAKLRTAAFLETAAA